MLFRSFAPQIHALIPKCSLLENFTAGEVQTLSQFMEVYRAPEGTEVIRENDGAIATLTMNRPDQLNTLSEALLGALQAEFDRRGHGR